MMKILVLLFIIFFSLNAKDAQTCYSVQLKSFVPQENYVFKGYPPSCFLLKSSKFSSIRCGCFEGYSEAKAYQKELKVQGSMIVQTYKHHVDAKLQVSENDDQELRLLFQVFSYSSDLDNAYITEKKALKLYPDSLYWHEKMADVAMWTDRRGEAVENMMYVYKRTHNKKLEDKIFKYSLSAYQYKTAALIIEKKVRKNPSKENVEQMVYIFDLLGKPLESAELLDEVYQKDPSRKHLLTQELQIYLNMGEMNRAKKVVKQIEAEQMHDIASAYLVSHYYFLKQKIEASYRTLSSADVNGSDGNLTQFYMQLSDLSWYVKDYEGGAEASLKVQEKNATRLVDYERIMQVYKKKDPLISRKAALDGYMKFDQNYLFYTYAYMGIDAQAYNEVLDAYYTVEQNQNNTLVDEALYWMIKAQLYASLNQNTLAKRAFYKAQMLSPSSNQLLVAYIWFLMDIKDERGLSKVLFTLEEKGDVDSSLWLPLAVAYFQLQNGDRAAYYLEKIDTHGMHNTDSRLLYAYVKQSQNEQGAFYKEIRLINKQMTQEIKQDPKLENDSDFMKTYLNVIMFLVNADTFERRLKKAKPILKEEAYKELELSFSLRENVDEQVHYNAQSMKKLEPWIKLNLALSANDKTSQQDLLYKYYRSLPLSDSISSAQNDNQISFAQDLVFNGLEKNEKNELLYDQMRQLHENHADYFLMKSGYLNRTGLNQSYSDMHNSYYLAKGYSLEADLFASSNSINDDEVFKSIPSTSTAFGLGIKKDFERGSYEVSVGTKDSADMYNYLSLKYSTLISRRLNIEFLADIGAKAEESVYLLVGGYKNRLAVQTQYSLLESSTIGLYLEKSKYKSDDGTDLGSGLNGRLDFSYLQRSAYPDLSITPYYTFGNYDENDGSKGLIDDMLNFPDTKVISDDFWYLGADFSYGMQNRYNYVRVWRPFLSVSPYYNGRESALNFGFTAGVGGEVFGQDNLAIIVNYASSVGGTNDTLWRSYLRYKILY